MGSFFFPLTLYPFMNTWECMMTRLDTRTSPFIFQILYIFSLFQFSPPILWEYILYINGILWRSAPERGYVVLFSYLVTLIFYYTLPFTFVQYLWARVILFGEFQDIFWVALFFLFLFSLFFSFFLFFLFPLYSSIFILTHLNHYFPSSIQEGH